MAPEDVAQVKRLGQVDYMVLTNRDHARESAAYRSEFRCQLWVPDADAPQMEVKPDKTYKDGELLPGGMWAVHLRDQKSPGETALFIQQAARTSGAALNGIMIVGDALLGKPAGSVSMLAAEKYADPQKAREGLGRLLKYHFDVLLVGDGASIIGGARQAVETFLQA
jgi:glyoxylase-like metal-dependent hydrolase (beta-lactamase superfamily II)